MKNKIIIFLVVTFMSSCSPTNMYEPSSCLDNEYRVISTGSGSAHFMELYIKKTNLTENEFSLLQIFDCLVAEYYNDIVAQNSYSHITVYKRNFDSYKYLSKEHEFIVTLKVNPDSYEIIKISGSKNQFQKSEYYTKRSIKQSCCANTGDDVLK